jgi:hypothetical protein
MIYLRGNASSINLKLNLSFLRQNFFYRIASRTLTFRTRTFRTRTFRTRTFRTRTSRTRTFRTWSFSSPGFLTKPIFWAFFYIYIGKASVTPSSLRLKFQKVKSSEVYVYSCHPPPLFEVLCLKTLRILNLRTRGHKKRHVRGTWHREI